MITAIFRHGHKSYSHDFDPDLSPKGFDQALLLQQWIENQKLPQPTHLWVSPKKRTAQTFQKLSESYALPPQIKKNLDTRQNEESTQQFRMRIEGFLNFLAERKKSDEVHFICTHYDWIEEFLSVVPSDTDLNSPLYSYWAPGEFMLFDVQDGFWIFQQKGVLV